MLAAMQDHMAASAHTPQVPTAVCSALRRIAVNDEICMEFADAGGVTVTMQVSLARAPPLASCMHLGPAAVGPPRMI